MRRRDEEQRAGATEVELVGGIPVGRLLELLLEAEGEVAVGLVPVEVAVDVADDLLDRKELSLAPLLDAMGVRMSGGRVEFDADAALAGPREAVTRPR